MSPTRQKAEPAQRQVLDSLSRHFKQNSGTPNSVFPFDLQVKTNMLTPNAYVHVCVCVHRGSTRVVLDSQSLAALVATQMAGMLVCW